MGLSKRLEAIVNYVDKNSIVGDIGTDHGYIPIHLIRENISKKVIATDISKDCLQKTIDYVEDLNYQAYIETRLGDGLDPIKAYEIDSLIMAGIGGVLIRDILEANREKSRSIVNFIFQPMTASRELRSYLKDNQFKIVDEDLVKEDGKFYEIIYAKKGLELVEDNIYLEIGKRLLDKKHPLLQEFIEYKINSSKNIMGNLQGIDTEKAKNRYLKLKEGKKKYKEVLSNVKSW